MYKYIYINTYTGYKESSGFKRHPVHFKLKG